MKHVIAKAVRVEMDSRTKAIYLVFEVTDERFRQIIKQDWTQDLEVEILNRDLIMSEGKDDDL